MGSVPPLLLIGTGIICLGVLLHIIGLATHHWYENTVGSSGLFQLCGKSTCVSIEDPPSKLEAVQAMAIIGMLCGLLGGAMALVFVLMNLMSKTASKMMTMISAGACMAAFVFIIIGIIIYGEDTAEITIGNLGYSFALSIVGGIMLAVGGVLVFIGSKSVG